MTVTVQDFYHAYKFYHFFAVCFGLGCGMISYRPYYPLVMPTIIVVFSIIAFEIFGVCCGLPSHINLGGTPYHWKDAVWGFTTALLVAILHREYYYAYTLSYGWGIIVFALRGAKRKW